MANPTQLMLKDTATPMRVFNGMFKRMTNGTGYRAKNTSKAVENPAFGS